VLDVEHHLALDQQLVVEHERILREVHRAFNGVLDRHEAEVDVARRHGVKHVGYGAHRDALVRGEVGLRKQRLLGESAGRPEIRDAACFRHLVKATSQR